MLLGGHDSELADVNDHERRRSRHVQHVNQIARKLRLNMGSKTRVASNRQVAALVKRDVRLRRFSCRRPSRNATRVRKLSRTLLPKNAFHFSTAPSVVRGFIKVDAEDDIGCKIRVSGEILVRQACHKQPPTPYYSDHRGWVRGWVLFQEPLSL